MAPPMPLTILPGMIQFARSPLEDTSMPPRMVSPTLQDRIMPKLSEEEKVEAPRTGVTVCFPALIQSGSAWRADVRAGLGQQGARANELSPKSKIETHLALLGERAHPHETVLGLELDPNTLGKVVGRHGGDPNSKVYVHAVLELLGCTAHDATTAARDGRLGGGVGFGGDLGELLDALLVVRRLNDLVNEDSGEVDLVGMELAGLNNLLNLGNTKLACPCSVGVEVPGSAPAMSEAMSERGREGGQSVSVAFDLTCISSYPLT